MTVRVRFAPSPTGCLHIGNARTALFNYLFAKKMGGKFILRIEDTDSERSRPEYAEALVEDLAWFGIRWDEGPGVGGEWGPYRQSEKLHVYQEAAERLIREGKAYSCYVTEEEVDEMKHLAVLEKRPPRFDNRGRHFTKAEIEARKARGVRPTVRFRIENPRLKIHDLIRGAVEFNLDEMVGDFIILRADGLPTFHLAVCVDDGFMKVTHVLRGEDHLSNTPKHLLLLEALGFSPPQYGHLSLIHGPGGEPLSKRLESVSLREFRRRGYLPEALANYLALLGWSPGDDREIFSWKELQEAFDLGRVGKSASIYDPHKLDWVNGEHLRALSDEEFSKCALAYLKKEGRLKPDETAAHRLLPVFKDNVERLEELEDRLQVLDDDFSYEDEAGVKGPSAQEIFHSAAAVLNEMQTGGAGQPLAYEKFMEALKPRVKAKGKDLFVALRLALTGKTHGPELKRLFPLLGPERVRVRFERARNLK